MRIIVFIWIALFWGCRADPQPLNNLSMDIRIDSLQLDSVNVRLIHYMDGRELFDTLVPVNQDVQFVALDEDMYLLAIYWPRTFVTHQSYNSPLFNEEEGEFYMLTKAFYINPQETDQYRFYLDSTYTIDQIEIDNIRKLNLDAGECMSCMLAERYWNNYNDFFERKDNLLEQMNQSYYQATDSRSADAPIKYRHIDSIKNEMWTDSVYQTTFDSLVTAYPDNVASTFFVFYQLYTDRALEKYRGNFLQLRDEAKRSRYYPMLAGQYED